MPVPRQLQESCGCLVIAVRCSRGAIDDHVASDTFGVRQCFKVWNQKSNGIQLGNIHLDHKRAGLTCTTSLHPILYKAVLLQCNLSASSSPLVRQSTT
ncbi:hypothetical protein BDN72DRAFT_153111 [Pluteus cervinus]|uniref:Uncharacterized protein n=1 Tax=Pluteus cervinus TaxID=181527 RepID=A0ACD3B9W4_9AGAR|nr:hypothetical protein BDN72DRAFT_153111 [Pluteus cervinus]